MYIAREESRGREETEREESRGRLKKKKENPHLKSVFTLLISFEKKTKNIKKKKGEEEDCRRKRGREKKSKEGLDPSGERVING